MHIQPQLKVRGSVLRVGGALLAVKVRCGRPVLELVRFCQLL